MKKIMGFLLVLGISLFFNSNVSLVSAEEKQRERDEYTFGEIETLIENYLKENNYDLVVGTPEFNEFVIDQMNNDTDEKMASLENYHLFNAYFAEYLYD